MTDTTDQPLAVIPQITPVHGTHQLNPATYLSTEHRGSSYQASSPWPPARPEETRGEPGPEPRIGRVVTGAPSRQPARGSPRPRAPASAQQARAGQRAPALP